MKRLTAYLARLFVLDSMILLLIVCTLLWMVNCLRSFDVVSVKGQGLWTLASQALLTLPPLAISFFYVCIGIGLARALQALQTNSELAIIHTSASLGAMWRAVGVVMGVGVLLALLLSHFLEPYSNRQLTNLSTSVAADLVSSTLKPERFIQVTPGVILLIGGRAGDGNITQFYADDRRDPETRRTYIARSARVASDGEDYVLELHDGTLQYAAADGRFSQIAFTRYDLNVARLSQPLQEGDYSWEKDSLTLVREALASGQWSEDTLSRLSSRMGDGLRVMGICLVVLAISAFPSGRRARIAVPTEVFVILIAFLERGASAYSPYGPNSGGWLLIAIGGAALLWRLRPRHPKAVPA